MSKTKMKSRKSAAKRFSLTGAGKVKRKRANLRHNLSTRPHKVKKRALKIDYVHPSDVERVKRMLVYSA